MGAISKANGCCHTNCLLPHTVFLSAVNTTDQENCVKKWGFWGQFFVEFVKGKLQQFVFVLTQLLSFLEHIAVHSRSMPFRTRSWSSFFKNSRSPSSTCNLLIGTPNKHFGKRFQLLRYFLIHPVWWPLYLYFHRCWRRPLGWTCWLFWRRWIRTAEKMAAVKHLAAVSLH